MRPAEETVVRQCAPTLAGIKTGSLFPCPYDSRQQLLADIRRMNRVLVPRTEEEFPHEVGLFLSYPPEDVQGFIDHRAEDFKCAGLWKVYGDEQRAQLLFDRFRRCTQRYCALWQTGYRLEQLAVAV